MKKIKLFLILFIFTVLNVNLFSQQSNINKGTGTTIKSDIDNFMDVQNFSNISFDNYFTYANFSNLSKGLELGFRKNFKKFFLGTYLNSNLMPITDEKVLTKNEYQEYHIFSNFDNKIDILLGFGNMAFKLGFINNKYKNTSNDSYKTNIDSSISSIYKDTKQDIYSLYLIWGSSFELSKFFLKPYARICYDFGNYKIYSSENIMSKNYSYDYKSINASIGFDFDIKTSNKFHSVAGFKYSVYFDKYNYYDYKDIKNYDNKQITTSFEPSYIISYTLNEKLIISATAKLQHNIFFSNIIYTNNSISPLKGIQATVTPVIGIGTRYSIKPDIISFNLGTFITLPRSKINYLFSEDDIYSNSEIKIQKISASINTGFDWNITKNFTMDIALTIPVAPAISDKVINYLSVGVSLKK